METTVILTGHRKSGTSLFQRLFDGHTGINLYPIDITVLYAYFPCFTANPDLKPKDLRKRLRHLLEACLTKGNDIAKKKGFEFDAFAELVDKQLDDNQLKDKCAVIQAIRKAWVELAEGGDDTRPFVFKETSQAIFYEEFKKLPGMKMISLIRDPRDNYAAIKVGVEGYYSKFGESEKSSLASVINRVRMDLKAAQLLQKQYPDSFLAIRFEDLLTDPKKTMLKVCKFLGIPFDETLITPTIMGEPYKGNSREGKVFKGISTANLGKWKERIAAEEAKILEYWLDDVMEHWNYKRKYKDLECQEAFSEFYPWYNCQYFYKDSFR